MQMQTTHIVRGHLLTMDPARPSAEAMLVSGERIAAIGSFEQMVSEAPAGTPVLDRRHGTIVPGLIDSHNHMLSTGMQNLQIDLGACRSIADVSERIRAFAARNPELPWLSSGPGWQIESLAEGRYPTRAELDAASPDRPVILNRGGHIGVANSRALALAGIDRDTPDPEGGRIVREDDGTPSGLLLEDPALRMVQDLVPPMSPANRRAALKEVQQRYHAAGLTSVVDPGLGSDDIGIYQDLWRTGELTMRSTVMPLAQTSGDPEVLLDRLKAWGVRSGFGDTRLKIGGIKVFMDGGGSLGTALMREPYLDERCNCGIQVTHTWVFHQIAEFCATHGWSLGVHTVGGKAIDIALDVFAKVDEETPIRDLRFSIIHAYLWPSADNIATARRLGVGVATQPTMQYNFAPTLVKRFGTEAFGAATPIRSWLDGGVKVGGGSDSPINPYPPLLGIWHAVTRYVDALDQAVGPSQAVTPDEALAMYTSQAAWFTFSDHDVGCLREGMLADWVLLSKDPLSCPPSEIRDLAVLETVVGGRSVFARGSA